MGPTLIDVLSVMMGGREVRCAFAGFSSGGVGREMAARNISSPGLSGGSGDNSGLGLASGCSEGT